MKNARDICERGCKSTTQWWERAAVRSLAVLNAFKHVSFPTQRVERYSNCGVSWHHSHLILVRGYWRANQVSLTIARSFVCVILLTQLRKQTELTACYSETCSDSRVPRGEGGSSPSTTATATLQTSLLFTNRTLQ